MRTRNVKKYWKNRFEDELYFPKKPIFELLDLKVDVGRVDLVKPFVRLRRLMLGFEWTATTWSWVNFLGGSALTNGLDIIYNNEPLLPIKIIDNFGFKKYKFNALPEIDTDATTKRIVFAGRLSWFKLMDDRGLDMRDKTFSIDVRDDLRTAGGTDAVIEIIAEGWGWAKQ